MSILNRLQVNQLRNLESVSIELSPAINFFYGENGSGKTSILEAIALLGLGRSFRSHKSRSLINHSTAELTVFADITIQQDANLMPTNTVVPVGIQKQRNGSGLIKVAGEVITSAALLAKQLPLQVINANAFLLVEGAPAQRRQFLDWMVFHVKPEFSTLWKELQKVLKQRNSLLRRDKINRNEIVPWDKEFARLAQCIHQHREEVFHQFSTTFIGLEKAFLGSSLSVELSYMRGWDEEQDFIECLQQSFDRDQRDGYSHYGPHRADIKIRANDKPASEVLSRGQEKSLVCAMHIAQAELYKELTQHNCVFLVDDLSAELDTKNSQQFATWLTSTGGQVFVTGVSKEVLLASWQPQIEITPALFHVKQGRVERE